MKSEEEIRLNKDQRNAVEHKKGPLLIIAGAGTGKTTVITERIKHLITNGLAKPEEILALTFTEKAAREMETRVDIVLPYGSFGLWISTFHSFCDKILREEALNIGLISNFKLMSDAETYLFIKQNFWKFKLSYFRPNGNPYKFIEGLIQHFDRLKDEDVSVEKYLTFAKKINNGKTSEVEKEDTKKFLELAAAYKTYEELKIKEGVMDFSDLIGNVLKLFRTRKGILSKYIKQFKYILIDEFQDTNFSQYQLIKLLAPSQSTPNLTVVGDDSQSIYKFRGAAISNILFFMKDYPMAKQVILNTSYRCSQTVLDAAYKLIKNNDPNTLEASLGISKNLVADKNYKGEKIELFLNERVEAEADSVVNFIKEYKKENKNEYKDFAILVRANNHSEPFIRALERAMIPFQFLGPGMLFHQPEVKDLIAYLKILYDFTDSASLYRVLSMNIWQLSARDIIAVLNLAKKSNNSFFEQLELVEKISNISETSRKKFIKFVEMVHKHQELIKKETAGQILYYFLIDSGLIKSFNEIKSQREEKKVQNIGKFFDRLKSFEASHEDASVFAVVDYLDLAIEMGESPLAAETDWTENEAVNILTVHSAKGLEFPVVILVNLVEGRFPSRERRDQIPLPDDLINGVLPVGDYHLQEERRLFYVGMTRAEKKLILTGANFYGEGKRERKFSPFIDESLGKVQKKQFIINSQQSQIPLFEWMKPEDEVDIREKQSKGLTKVDFLSYSAIETFRTCPLHFRLRYILRVPVPPTASQALGNSIHYTLRDFYSDHQSFSELGRESRDSILKLLKKDWVKMGYSSKIHEKESYEKAEKFLLDYLNSDLHKKARPIFLEKQFNFWIENTLKILGKIDRVDDLGNGIIEIIDYKTGANVPKQKDLDNNMQMTIYALSAISKGIFGKTVDQVKMSFYFFDSGEKISTVRTLSQLEKAKKDLLKIRSDIENSDFKCSKGIICQNCEYKILCNE